ncbi:hypothetical protein ACKLNO_09475 [Neisseriaceae bacterium B1]
MLSQKLSMMFTASLLGVIPLSVQAAVGIPVVDGGANTHLKVINQSTAQSEKTLQRINNNINITNNKLDNANNKLEQANKNWDELFRQLAKGKLSDIYGLNLSNDNQLSQEQYTQFQEEAKSRCQKIGNKNNSQNESKDLCLKMIEIDKQKIKHYFQSLEDMKQATNALKNAVQA